MILINSSPRNALKIFQPFLPIFVPIGVGCLLASLHDEHIEAQFVDEQVDHNPLAKIEWYVKTAQKPCIFGFSVITAALNNAITLSKYLKEKYPGSIIIFGGIHPTAAPDEVMALPQVDYVMRGESERPLAEFYRCIKAGGDVTHIQNLSYRKHGAVFHNKIDAVPSHLEGAPVFPYHLFDPKKYDLGFVLSSRGCPYNCIFCSNRVSTGKIYRYKAPLAVVDKLEKLNKKYGKTHILFIDDNFLVNKERVYQTIEEIKRRGLHKKIVLNFQARADNVDREILTDLRSAGFGSIFFGIETASEQTMKMLKKGETVAQCIDAVKLAKSIGFHVSATFLYGLPGDSFRRRMDCVRLTKALDLDMVRYNNATPYPGTELYEMAKREKRLHIVNNYENFNSVSTFIENPFNKIPLSYVPANNTEAEIRRDLLYSYFVFYLDLRKLKKIFANPEKGAAWFNAGESFVTFMRKVPAVILLALMMSVKFLLLFHYIVIRKDTRISLSHFLTVFQGLHFWEHNPETELPGVAPQ